MNLILLTVLLLKLIITSIKLSCHFTSVDKMSHFISFLIYLLFRVAFPTALFKTLREAKRGFRKALFFLFLITQIYFGQIPLKFHVILN